MACDISDPKILQQYSKIQQNELDYLILGYKGTRDQIFLYESGKGDIDDLKQHFQESVHFALLNVNNQLIYIVYVESEISDELVDKINKLPNNLNSKPLTPKNKSAQESPMMSPQQEFEQVEEVVPTEEQQTIVNIQKDFDEDPNTENENLDNDTISLEQPKETGLMDAVSEKSINNSINIETGNPRHSKYYTNNQSLKTDDDVRDFNLKVKSKVNQAMQNKLNAKNKYQANVGQDVMDTIPTSMVEFNGKDNIVIEDACFECLIVNSFKVVIDKSNQYLFFSDDNRQKELAIAALKQLST